MITLQRRRYSTDGWRDITYLPLAEHMYGEYRIRKGNKLLLQLTVTPTGGYIDSNRAAEYAYAKLLETVLINQ